MTFDQFSKNIPKIKNLPLPGSAYQFKMSPPFRENLLEQYKLEMKNANRAGVLALFYPDKEEDCRLVLILRKTYKGVHSAQVGFPGGKYERGDIDLEMTSLRETEEEIGVDLNEINILKAMTEIYIPPSNFMVYPFIGFTSFNPEFKKQDDEVEDIIEVKVSDLIDDKNVSKFKVMTSLRKELEVPAFYLANQIVWGATAMMLSEIKELIKRLN